MPAPHCTRVKPQLSGTSAQGQLAASPGRCRCPSPVSLTRGRDRTRKRRTGDGQSLQYACPARHARLQAHVQPAREPRQIAAKISCHLPPKVTPRMPRPRRTGCRPRCFNPSPATRRDRRECVMLYEEEVDVADRAPTIRRYAEVAPRELPSGACSVRGAGANDCSPSSPGSLGTGRARQRRFGPGEYSSEVQQPWYMQVDAGGRTRMGDLPKYLIRVRLPVTTDQKVGGSSPSERASELATSGLGVAVSAANLQSRSPQAPNSSSMASAASGEAPAGHARRCSS